MLNLALIYFLTCFIFVNVGDACPHTDTNLKSWNAATSWPNNIIPVENDNVTLSGNILLDTAIPEFFSITVTGKLVLKPGMNHKIRVHYLLIEDGGELHVGSEGCEFTDEAEITLVGEANEGVNIAGFGDKFLGVKAGGTLELHGPKTITWTKLTQTAEKFGASGVIREEVVMGSDVRGIYAYHLTTSGDLKNETFARLRNTNQDKEDEALTKVVNFIKNIDDGDVVALGTHKDVIDYRHYSVAVLATYLNEILGTTSVFKDIKEDAAYALFGIKGNSNSYKEMLTELDSQKYSYADASVSHWFTNSEIEFHVRSLNYVKSGNCRVYVQVYNTIFSKPVINVYDDVTQWGEGNKIFITSTDYHWRQTEEFTKIACGSCQKTQIRLSGYLKYTHFGEIYKNVDMRAEVGVMSHNIRIQAVVKEGSFHGGHVKALFKFKSVRIEGVEFTNLGHPQILGRYPFHYHMCDDLANTTVYPIRSYVRYNSFHHNVFRCMTIHGTHSARVIGNVCYDSFGHGFFLEDGGEKYTYYYGNLALGQTKWPGDTELGVTGVIPTDAKPVSFWTTNPLVTYIHNVGAGGDGAGFWFVYPNIPTGPSKDKGFMEENEAKHTKITRFEKNSVHSYVFSGLQVDNIMAEDLTIGNYNKYDAKLVPTDPNSLSVYAEFLDFTGFKNIKQHLWIRGAHIRVKGISLSDSLTAATLVSEGAELKQEFEDAVVLGESTNTGEPMEVKLPNGTKVMWNRSAPSITISTPRFGYVYNRGPTTLKNVFFDGFQKNEFYKTTAIGFHKCLEAFFNPRNAVENIKFAYSDPDEGLRVYDGNAGITGFCSKDGDIIHSFVDTDSSVIGEGHRILRNIPFHTTSQCSLRQDWNMVHCHLDYGMVEVTMIDAADNVTMMRSDNPYATSVASGSGSTHFYMIMGEGIDYLGYFNQDISNNFKIKAYLVTNTASIMMGFCIPKNAEFEFKYKIGTTRVTEKKVNASSDVQSAGDYYYDGSIGVVLFKLIHDRNFGTGETGLCPSDECVSLQIIITSGDLSQNDCSSSFKETYGKTSKGSPQTSTTVLPKTADNPTSTQGVASTYPFTIEME